MRSRSVLSALALLSSVAVAQGPTAIAVLPASLSGSFGNNNSSIPFSWSPTQYQQVFDGTEIPASYTMTGLGLRQDELFSGIAGNSVDLEIQLGVTTLGVTTLTTNFANNFNSGAPTTVLVRQNIVLPTMSATRPTNPAVFLVQIPFTTPFQWTGAAGRNLLIQVTNRGNGNGNNLFSYPLDAGANVNTTQLYGFPDTATVGNLVPRSGLVMFFMPNGSVAQVETSGQGCGGRTASFYESFATNTFDLSNTSVRMTPNGSGYACVSGATQVVPPVSASLNLTDDSVTPAITLPFTFPYPGGSTNRIVICSNGFIYLGTGTASPYTPSVQDLLTGTPRIFTLWMDLLPTPTNNVHFDVDAANSRVLVTWNGVQEYGSGTSSNTMQIVLYSSGVAEIVFGACANLTHNGAMTAWSPGGNARDPGPIDISASLPFNTFADLAPLTQGAQRPVMGTTANLLMTGIPASSLAGVALIGPPVPGFDLSGAGAPGCFLYVSPILITLSFYGTPSASIPLPIPNTAGVNGVRLPVQSVCIAPGLNPFGLATSNLATLVLGQN